jgi:small subunit ribosomal protein S6
LSDRTYEILFIADPNLSETDVEALATTVQGFVERDGGKVTKNEKWGKKRLAYNVGRHREGSYVLLVAEGSGPLMKEVERRMNVIDGIIRHIVVRVDEDIRKAERRKSRRAAEDPKRRARAASRDAGAEGEGVQW